MPICPICDDTGLQNSDPNHPEFCYCAAGKQAKRQWEAERAANKGKGHIKPASFIDIAHLEEVNASVDAMRASLLGSATSEPASSVLRAAAKILRGISSARLSTPPDIVRPPPAMALLNARPSRVIESSRMNTSRPLSSSPVYDKAQRARSTEDQQEGPQHEIKLL